jgi:hypothetical protein
MRRNSHRLRSRLTNRFRPRMETLEARRLLACDLRMLDDGTLQITGDDTEQIASVVDRGHGRVNVQCQDQGGRVETRNFARVTGIVGDFRGGPDVFKFLSDQDVNAALPKVNVSLGEETTDR